VKLHIRAVGAEPYDLTDDYWTLEEAVEEEARKLAADAGSEVLESPSEACRDAYRRQVAQEALAGLNYYGVYTDDTGVQWTLETTTEDDYLDDGEDGF
jgi:hypothetical protein